MRQLQGPEPRFGPSSQGLGLGLGGASSRVWGPWPGWGVRGLGPGFTGAWGPGPQGLGARAACDQFFVVLKSFGRGLAKGWESAE